MLHAFLFTQSGIPVLYSGDEIGQLNEYSYHKDPLKADDSRYLHRGNFNWDEAALRNDTSTRQGILFQAIRRLAMLRQRYEVFETEADAWIVETWNDHVLGIGRYYKGEKLIALFNFSEFNQTAWIDEQEDYYDMLTGQRRPARAVGVPGYGFAWLLTDFTKAGSPLKDEDKMRDPGKEVLKETPAKQSALPDAQKVSSKKAAAAAQPHAKKTSARRNSAGRK